MKLTVLGCGDAFGSGGRFNTSFLLTVKERHVLVDCGASTLIRLKQMGVEVEKIETIIITHFHGDHFGGVPFIIISCLFEKARDATLNIVGPKGVKEHVLRLLEEMYPGTSEKLGRIDLCFYEFQDGDGLDIADLRVLALPVEHSEASAPHGVKVSWEGKIFAFSGDTSWTDHLITLCDGADLFICECNFLERQAFGHLSYKELVEKRSQLNCHNIWLSHMGSEVLQLEEVLFDRLEDGLEMEF